MKKGSIVVLKPPFYHQGNNIGDRLAVIIDDQSYFLVEVLNYNYNPVKCFRNELEEVPRDDNEPLEIDDVEWNQLWD